LEDHGWFIIEYHPAEDIDLRVKEILIKKESLRSMKED